ncbi:MAG: DNA polymerase III subunit epsilon [Gammaproteobacteria bacterium]|nr:DNA polymerase III subunit epsilon [Gammaproteobacteria bacterium]
MKQIILDTETTGLETADGHRVIEIGCIELIDRRSSGNRFHQYINPERDIEDGALEVHGISREFLQDKPVFADVVDDLLQFVSGSELIIHNAPFDVGFLDSELSLLNRPDRMIDHVTVLDTLELARDLHPGQRNSLDALCKRYEVDNSSRSLHGALLDAEILADVYLAMTGGQTDLGLSFQQDDSSEHEAGDLSFDNRPQLLILTANAGETEAHEARIKAIQEKSGHCLWSDL